MDNLGLDKDTVRLLVITIQDKQILGGGTEGVWVHPVNRMSGGQVL